MPTDESIKTVPDAHIKGKFHAPIMFTTDLALRYDEAYGKITKRWLDNPKELNSLRTRMVQADPPGYGTAGSLPRQGRPR